jgi:Skp family chaperone for outer membrane proteins
MAVRWAGVGLALAVWLAAPVFAQTAEVRPSILTLDQDALFAGSKFGQALTRAIEAEAEALKAENRDIDTRLEAEERALTQRRATMAPAEFRPLAEAFDQKVEALRAAQDAKARAFAQKRDEGQSRFIQMVGPILGDYMVQQGAFAIVNQAAIVVSLGTIDITDEVIAAVDAQLGDGSSLPPDAIAKP